MNGDNMIFNSGVWPTMITIFDSDNKLDLAGNKRVARHLMKSGAAGIFTVCQSSEMFALSIDEKVLLAETILAEVGDEIQVIASGHTSDTIEEQIEELKAVAATGVYAVVLVANRLDVKNQGGDVLLKNAERILSEIPDIDFGIYECPFPYHRLLSEREIEWCAKSGRIKFFKDVCCDAELQKKRIELVRGTSLKLFNANTQTMLNSLQLGYDGFNGVMCNFHIDIYNWMYNHFSENLEKSEKLQAWLTETCAIEGPAYPAIAKYHLNSLGLDVGYTMRVKPNENLTAEIKEVSAELIEKENAMRKFLGIECALVKN